MNPEQNPWKINGEKIIYDNPWIGLTEYDVTNPSGGKGIYGKVRFKGLAIGILPLDEQLNTWLVGQYRFPIDQYSWELPEGGGDFSVDPVISAQRELLEETGLKAGKWDRVLDLHLSNSVTDEAGIAFLARELTQHEAQPEETEQLVVRKLPFKEAFRMVMEGAITDSISVATILKVSYLLEHDLI